MSPSSVRLLMRVLSAVAVAWAVLVVAAPWLGSNRLAAATYLSGSVYGLGALVCHQEADRSFHLAGAQLPVCARCAGLYLSAAAAILMAWGGLALFRAAPARVWRARLLWAALPTAATLAVEWWRPATASGLMRAAASVPLGATAGALLAESAGFRGRLRGCERTRESV